MTPATVVHQSAGRIRFRVPSEKGNEGFFRSVERTLRGLPHVTDVVVTPTTASVLVRHRGEATELGRLAREAGLFEIRDEPLETAVLDAFREHVLRVDSSLRRATSGKTDLGTLSFLGLAAAGFYQISRGHVFPAGTALLVQAVALGMRQRPSSAIRPEVHPRDPSPPTAE